MKDLKSTTTKKRIRNKTSYKIVGQKQYAELTYSTNKKRNSNIVKNF